MVDGFDGLWHHPIICCYNQDGNIGNRCTTRPHRSKGRVSRCIQEGNLLTIFHDLVGTDVLGDSSRFTCCYTGITKGIQKGSLPVVNVSHDGDNWWTLYQLIWIQITIFNEEAFDIGIVYFNLFLGFNSIIHHQEFNRISIQRLVLSRHDSHHKEFLDDFSRFTLDAFCDFGNRHSIRILKFTW